MWRQHCWRAKGFHAWHLPEQCGASGGIIEWLGRWGLKPGTTKVIADDAVFNATGGPKGSTAGDFQAAGCPLMRAGKMNQRRPMGWHWCERCCRRVEGMQRRRGAVDDGLPGVDEHLADVAEASKGC